MDPGWSDSIRRYHTRQHKASRAAQPPFYPTYFLQRHNCHHSRWEIQAVRCSRTSCKGRTVSDRRHHRIWQLYGAQLLTTLQSIAMRSTDCERDSWSLIRYDKKLAPDRACQIVQEHCLLSSFRTILVLSSARSSSPYHRSLRIP